MQLFLLFFSFYVYPCESGVCADQSGKGCTACLQTSPYFKGVMNLKSCVYCASTGICSGKPKGLCLHNVQVVGSKISKSRRLQDAQQICEQNKNMLSITKNAASQQHKTAEKTSAQKNQQVLAPRPQFGDNCHQYLQEVSTLKGPTLFRSTPLTTLEECYQCVKYDSGYNTQSCTYTPTDRHVPSRDKRCTSLSSDMAANAISNTEKCDAEYKLQENSVLVIGDLHADVDALEHILYKSGVTDIDKNWILDARITIVQLGDMIDGNRRDDKCQCYGSLDIIKRIQQLQQVAEFYNSKFIVLNGNHEVEVLLQHNFKYTDRNLVEDNSKTGVMTPTRDFKKVLNKRSFFTDFLLSDKVQTIYTDSKGSTDFVFVHGGIHESITNYLLQDKSKHKTGSTSNAKSKPNDEKYQATLVDSSLVDEYNRLYRDLLNEQWRRVARGQPRKPAPAIEDGEYSPVWFRPFDNDVPKCGEVIKGLNVLRPSGVTDQIALQSQRQVKMIVGHTMHDGVKQFASCPQLILADSMLSRSMIDISWTRDRYGVRSKDPTAPLFQYLVITSNGQVKIRTLERLGAGGSCVDPMAGNDITMCTLKQ